MEDQEAVVQPGDTSEDPKSLSWMAVQAVNALNAVKANQAEKGKSIQARTGKQKPVTVKQINSETKSKAKAKDKRKDKGTGRKIKKPGHRKTVETMSEKSVPGKKRESRRAVAVKTARPRKIATQIHTRRPVVQTDSAVSTTIAVDKLPQAAVQPAAEKVVAAIPGDAVVASRHLPVYRRPAAYIGAAATIMLVFISMTADENAGSLDIPTPAGDPAPAMAATSEPPSSSAQEWRPRMTMHYPYPGSMPPRQQAGKQRVPDYGYYHPQAPSGGLPGYRPAYPWPPSR